MRVLQLHNRYRLAGGEDMVVASEAALLRAAGHQVETYCVQNPRGPRAALTLLASPWNVKSAHDLRSVVKQLRPDIVHVHNTWFQLSSSAVAALGASGTPVVMTLHNYRVTCANGMLFRDGHRCQDCVASHPYHAVRHGCYRKSRVQSIPAALSISLNRAIGAFHNNVHCYIALSDFGRSLFARAGIPENRIVVAPHFVERGYPRRRPPSSSRDVICAGRLEEEKGVRILIQAFNSTSANGLRLTIFGVGPHEDRFRRVAGPNVRFAGRVPRNHVLATLADARALAFPTMMYETFGLTTVEAMAAGTPVVASDLGGTPEILGSAAGVLAAPGDVGAWTAAIDRLVDDRWVDKAGRAGRERWAKLFSPDAGLTRLEAAYDIAIRTSTADLPE